MTKLGSLDSETRKRILDQIRIDEQARNHIKSQLRSAEPEHASKKALEQSNAKPKGSHGGLKLRVTIIALRATLLDSHDNRNSSCKALVDVIAEMFGVDDSDPRVEWNIEQLKSKSRRTIVILEEI